MLYKDPSGHQTSGGAYSRALRKRDNSLKQTELEEKYKKKLLAIKEDIVNLLNDNKSISKNAANSLRRRLGVKKGAKWPHCSQFASRLRKYIINKDVKIFPKAKILANSNSIQYFGGKDNPEKNANKLKEKLKIGNLIIFDSKDKKMCSGHIATITGFGKIKLKDGTEMLTIKIIEGHQGNSFPTAGNVWDGVKVREYRADYLMNWGKGINPNQNNEVFTTGRSVNEQTGVSSRTVLKLKGFARWKEK